MTSPAVYDVSGLHSACARKLVKTCTILSSFTNLSIGTASRRPVKLVRSLSLAQNNRFAQFPQSAAPTGNVTDMTSVCVMPLSASTDIFISPGYQFKVIDGLLTNFHLPKSTLIMLVSAFLGREKTLEAYDEAVREQYRFFSFGDAMLIL